MRFLTAGESHGKGLVVIVDHFPAGVPVSSAFINHELKRRQQGYGRGGRMKIETDEVTLFSGIRFGKTTGAPISFIIENRDYPNWTEAMAPEGVPSEAASAKKFTRPRPGHADLAGFYKFGHQDLRDVLERASARETAARVAVGALAKQVLAPLDMTVLSHVSVIGGVCVPTEELPENLQALQERAEGNDCRCAGSDKTIQAMRQRVDQALAEGTTLGGTVEIIVSKPIPGLGSYAQWDQKLDGRLAQALMSIPAVKSVTIGSGDLGSHLTGHEFHDEITLNASGQHLVRPSNRSGGLEGGVTNGMPLVLKAVMKPISTVRKALRSINLETGEEEPAHFERSDVTAVPACAVVCEAMVSIILAQALLEKFGQDTFEEIVTRVAQYQEQLKFPTAL